MKIRILFLLVIFLNYGFEVNSSDSVYDKIIQEYNRQIEDYMKNDSISSISYSIIMHGQIISSKAFGYSNYEKHVLADTNTIYRIGSLTKPVTAFLMMQMAEKGYFGLDDKVEIYLPEIKNLIGYSDSTQFTFRQLACHTSGLPENVNNEFAIGLIDTWEEKVISAIPTVGFDYKSGKDKKYSNFGYGILGLAISRAVGKPFIKLVKENIFSPLNMTNTFFELPPEKLKQLAYGEIDIALGEDYQDTPEQERINGKGYKVPVGVLYSTPSDYSKFLQALMSTSDSLIMSSVQCNLMKKSGIGLGIGKVNNELTIINHNGSATGYTSHFAFDLNHNNGLVIMRNYFPETGYRKFTKGFLEKLNVIDNE